MSKQISDTKGQIEACVVMTTCASAEDADAIAKLLLDTRLAACVQVLDLTSHYTWKGKRTIEPEKLLLVKTRTMLYPKVQETIFRAHSYEVPEVLCLPVTRGSPAYLAWMAAVTSG